MKRSLVALLVPLLFLSALVESHAASYRFTNIADTTTAAPFGTFSSFGFSSDGVGFFNNPAAISGSNVAFYGAYGGVHGLFTGSGGPITTIVKTGDAAPKGTFHQLSDVSVSGTTVAFLGRYALPGLSSERGVFSSDGGPLTTVAKQGDLLASGTILGVVDSTISGDTVAFRAGVSSGSGIFVSSGGIVTPIVREGDSGPGGTFSSFSNAVISHDNLAFLANLSGDFGVFSSGEGTVVTIAKKGDAAPSGVFAGFSEPTVSGSNVAFRASYGGKTGILFGDGGMLTPIAETGVGTFGSFNAPAISGKMVAFRGLYSGGDGIFIGSGGPLSTIVKSGDPLFGSDVVSVGLGRFGLDPEGSGNVAFAYELADGRLGIAMAMQVPEPNMLLSCAIGFLGAGIMVRQRMALHRLP